MCRCTGYRPIIEAFESFSSCDKNEVPLNVIPDEIVQSMREVSSGIISINHKNKNIFARPTNIRETLKLMKNHPRYYLRQGGTGTYKKFMQVEYEALIDISGVAELKTTSIKEHYLVIGSGVTFTSLLKFLSNIGAEELSAASVLVELQSVVSSLASPQVRNIASLGGSLLWGHPASDLVPLLLAAEAELILRNTNGEDSQRTLEAVTRSGLKRGELLVSMRVPLSGRKVKFYKHARRNTADLAIANMGIGFVQNGSSLQDTRVYFGGIGIALEKCKQSGVIEATKLGMLLRDQENLNSLTLDSICSKIEQDFSSALADVSSFDKTAFRISLVAGFVLKFIDFILGNKESPEHSKDSLKFHQLYEKTPDDQEPLDPVTRPVPHVSSAEQCAGEALYVDDLPRYERELVLVPVQSSLACGTIKKIDPSKALGLPGVVDWIAAGDVPGRNLWGLGSPDEEIFPTESVNKYGQIIGLIAAHTKEAGTEGAKTVVVEFEELDPILTLGEAASQQSMFKEAVLRKDNRVKNKVVEPDTRYSVTGLVTLGGQEHYYWEPHSALVVPCKEKQEVLVHFGTQGVNGVQEQLAAVLAIPAHRITVKCRRMGGGFGGKERMEVALMAGVAAFKTGRPCRLVLTRDTDVAITGHRHETRAAYEVEHDGEGKMLRTKFNIDINAGNSVDLSEVWAGTLLRRIDGGYTLSNFEGQAAVCKTNLASNTAFRGFGSPEGALIIEDVIENIASKLSIDPALVREKNLTRQGDFPHHGTKPVNEDFLIRCWNECLEQSNYWEVRREVESFNRFNKYKKRGISINAMKFYPTIPAPFLNQASAYVRIYKDGSILLSHGGTEMGQGLHTKMIQVASKVLKVDMAKIHIVDSSTDVIANATTTGGSTGTDLNGFAVINACNKLMEKLEPLRRAFPDDPWEETVTKAYMGRTQLSAYGYYNTSPLDYDWDKDEGAIFNHFTFGVGCSMVEVDCLTGEHRVLRTDIVMDVGQSLNPAIDIGQIEGAWVQGYGYMTMEEMLHGNNGEILNRNLSTYKVENCQLVIS